MSRSRNFVRGGSVAFLAGLAATASPTWAQFKLPTPGLPLVPNPVRPTVPGRGVPGVPTPGGGYYPIRGGSGNQRVRDEDLEFLAPSSDPEELKLSVDAAWAKIADDAKSASTSNAFVPPVVNAFVDKGGAKIQEARARRALAGQLPIQAFDAAVADVASFLVKELPLDPAIGKAQSRQVLVVNKIEVPPGVARIDSPPLDVALESLHSKLASSEAIRANFLVISSRATKAQQALNAAGAGQAWKFAPIMGNEAGKANFGEYQADTIYVVSGKFYQSLRLDNHRLFISTIINVTKARTGEQIKSRPIGAEYRFHPYRMEWISAAEDEALKAHR